MNERNVLDLYTKGTNKLEGLESITSAQTSIPIKVFNLPSINNLIALMTVVVPVDGETPMRLAYYVMDAVYGGYDPQTASSSRASRSVAHIITSVVNHAKAKISSTMSFTESKDGDPAREDNTDSDYYKAVALLRSNTPEQILDVQLPKIQSIAAGESILYTKY
ncbi:hypothetical protein V1522DRAFT_392157 [Lipomyces starkeyi]